MLTVAVAEVGLQGACVVPLVGLRIATGVPPQRSQFVTEDRMGAGSALLDPADVQRSRSELDLIAAQVHQFGGAQPVPVGNQNHRSVPVSPAVALSRSHQPLDFGFGQVLAGAQLAIRQSLGGDCSFYGGWLDQLEVRFGHALCAPCPTDCSYKTSFTNCRVGQD